MTRSRLVALVASVGLAAAGAHAGTLATGLMYWDDGTPGTSCFVTNVGSKPVPITAATLQNDSSTDILPATDNCTGSALPPGHTCFWEGGSQTYGGGKLQFKGSAKSLRGRCVFRDVASGDVLGSAADLR